MTTTRGCVDWFDWDVWISDEPGPCGDFGSLLMRRGRTCPMRPEGDA